MMGVPSQMAPGAVGRHSISTVNTGKIAVLFICVLEILLVLGILCYIDHCTHVSHTITTELTVL